MGATCGRGPFGVRNLLQWTIHVIAAPRPCRQAWINGKPASAKRASCSKMCSVSLSNQRCLSGPHSLAKCFLHIHVPLTLVYANWLLGFSQVVQQRNMATFVAVKTVRRPAAAVQKCR